MIYRILHAGQVAEACHRRRIWLALGQPVIIGPQKIMTVLQHQCNGAPELMMRVEVPGQVFESPVPAGCELNINAWADLWAIPRVVEQDNTGRTLRLMVEFVRTSPSVQWAV